MTISLLVIALAAAACSDSASETSEPVSDVEPTTSTSVAGEDTTSPDPGSSEGEGARLIVGGAETVYSGTCSNLEGLGRATYFGTGTGANGEALEMSVSYTYPDGDFEASAGFTVLATGDGSIYVESNGLQAASFEDGVINIEAPMQGTSVDGRVNGILEVDCAG